ncbi:MAG TPA: SelB C-terminal domain-containing protein, partial [Calditrichia bacterium]|nr:SelB C-terminal domain-containing protein [Calditrichia bacterium]
TTARVILPEGELAPGASGFAQLRLKEPLHGAFGDPFIIRRLSPAMTIGGGTILQVNPVPYRKKWHERIIRQLASLKGEDHQASLMAAFDTIRIHSHTLWDLRVATGISMAEVQKQFNQLQKQGLAIPDESGSRKAFFSKAQIDLVLGAIESQLEKFHHQFPGRRGIIIEELISHLDKKLPREAVLTGVKEGISQKRLFGDHQFVCLNSFSPHLSGTDSAFYQTMLQEIREGGFAPLTIREFQEKLGISGGAMRELVGQLRQEGHIIIAEDNFVFDSGLLEHLKEILMRHFEQNEELSVADFRTHLGITRKHAMPLLTYLDRCNWTQRKDPVRVKGPELTTD